MLLRFCKYLLITRTILTLLNRLGRSSAISEGVPANIWVWVLDFGFQVSSMSFELRF